MPTDLLKGHKYHPSFQRSRNQNRSIIVDLIESPTCGKLRKNSIHQNIWLIFLISLLTSYYLKYEFFFFVIMNFTLGYLKSQVVHNHSIYRQFRWHGRLRYKIIKAKVASWWILRPHVPHLKKMFRFINELMQGVLL